MSPPPPTFVPSVVHPHFNKSFSSSWTRQFSHQSLVTSTFPLAPKPISCSAVNMVLSDRPAVSSSPRSSAARVSDPSLQQSDPVLYQLLEQEKLRQRSGLELIASENFTSRAVLETLGSVLTNKYSEGYPGARYYGGTEIIDQIEVLCQQRALKAFSLDPSIWAVNVQPYSGSPANFAAYTALLQPHDRIMGLDLPSGGHLTHGFYTPSKKVSATSIYFESFPYKVDPGSGLVDYDALERDAKVFRPKIIIAGGSAYPREWDYPRMRNIADDINAYLLVDMAHISGLVATGNALSPFQYADVVTTTTHKSLRGPRAGMIFFKKTVVLGGDTQKKSHVLITDMEDRINQAVFPSLQGGPHNHQIGALATQLLQVDTQEFKDYATQICRNAKALANTLIGHGYKLVTDGTDNHLMLWDLRPLGFTGSKMQVLCDACNITLNKNTVAGDASAMNPGGVRLGTPALTSRGFTEQDFNTVGDFLHRAAQIGLALQKESGPKLVDFKKAVAQSNDVAQLKKDIAQFATAFPMPGADINN